MAATYVETRRVPLDELTPYPGNAKRGDVPMILASLRRNGQYRGLVVRQVERGPLIVLAGNHTLQALVSHGPGPCGVKDCGVCRDGWDETARCEIVTCDDAEARRINLVDNRAAEMGTYDNDALAELLRDLGGDFDGTGYTQQVLDDLDELLELPAEDVEALAKAHGEPDEEVFRPEIRLKVSADLFDRWRAALDAHDGDDDTLKLAGLLTEVERYREGGA
jgi:ParB-like chromosome segregation protein Spo0J